jgi:hypothetical protein
MYEEAENLHFCQNFAIRILYAMYHKVKTNKKVILSIYEHY